MTRLLLISDQPRVLEELRCALAGEPLPAVSAVDVETALLLARGITLGVLDLATPRSWNLLARNVPLVALAPGPQELARALDSGALDALSFDYDPVELRARVRAALRRPGRVLGQLQVDVDARCALVGNTAMPLTSLEFEVLLQLAGSPGRTFSREELLSVVWGECYEGGTRRVDLVVSKLRRKLHAAGLPQAIRAIWGVGYRYEE